MSPLSIMNRPARRQGRASRATVRPATRQTFARMLGPLQLQANPEAGMFEDFGTRNPGAPAELERFAFLIGRWRCEARAHYEGGRWQTFAAAWVGRYILDGYAIEDEFRMTGPSGEIIVMGMNFRAYDAGHGVWQMKWLNAAGAWTDLGPEDLGGVRFEGDSITFVYREPVAGHPFTRATYTDITEDHFTWRGEQSDDQETWTEFLVIECRREGGVEVEVGL